MIEKLSDFLTELINLEKKKLNEYKLDHPPTIGKMYEGLTSEILMTTFPPSSNLKVVTGIMHDGYGNESGEIDCMLVKGDGEKIPYTESYKYHVKDVLAIVEVKKNLYANGISDSFEHLRDAGKTFHSYIQKMDAEENSFNIEPARRAFKEISGLSPNEVKNYKNQTIEYMYHTLVSEQLSPVRIIIGYNGYKSEYNLRNSFINYLNDKTLTRGFGIGSFPQLIICENFSLVKLNGQPFSSVLQNEFWHFYASSNDNPLTLLIELIWTKITNTIDANFPWGEDLQEQNLARFIEGKIVQNGEHIGWDYKYIDVPKKVLSERPPTREWEPLFVDNNTYTIFNILCKFGEIDITDTDFDEFLKSNDLNKEKIISDLQDTGFIVKNGNKLELSTYECKCICLPDGRFSVAEDNSGRFTRWIKKYFIDKDNGSESDHSPKN